MYPEVWGGKEGGKPGGGEIKPEERAYYPSSKKIAFVLCSGGDNEKKKTGGT